MPIFEITDLDIEILLSFLDETYSDIMKRVWRTPDHIFAVFITDELVLRTFSEQAIYIIVEHDRQPNKCRLDVSGLAGGDGLFRFDWGSQADAERTFTVRFKSLAEKHDWKWTIRKPEVKYRGAECPYCGAVYSYTEEHFNEDGTVSCQNCLKQFKP
ncbi:MAG: hypothetical protein KGY80_12580 [Candidatus Thorarchaeota archaeon]|nr:hypothetical protein [Candidatus Thorarchaeota archaeon]